MGADGEHADDPASLQHVEADAAAIGISCYGCSREGGERENRRTKSRCKSHFVFLLFGVEGCQHISVTLKKAGVDQGAVWGLRLRRAPFEDKSGRPERTRRHRHLSAVHLDSDFPFSFSSSFGNRSISRGFAETMTERGSRNALRLLRSGVALRVGTQGPLSGGRSVAATAQFGGDLKSVCRMSSGALVLNIGAQAFGAADVYLLVPAS